MADTIIDSLLVGLGFDYEDEGLKEFEQAVDSSLDAIDALALALAAVATATVAFAVASASATDEIAKEARGLDILVGELDALKFASEQTIGTSGGVAESLRQLSIRASEAARGTGSAVEAFGILGISATDANGQVKQSSVLLGEAADALNRLDNESQRLELADKLGISDLNLLLLEGSVGINKLTAEAIELGVVTEADAKAAEEFNDQWNRFSRVITNSSRALATTLLPLMTEVVTDFQEWLKVNEEIINSRILQFMDALVLVLENLELIIGAIISLKFAAFILKMVVAFKALGASAFLAQVKIFAIVIAIAAVIAAIGLLIQDFIVFKNGGDSAIGRLLERFPLLKKAIDFISDGLGKARLAVTDFLEWVATLFFKISRGIQDAQEAVKDFVLWVEGSIVAIGNFADTLRQKFVDALDFVLSKAKMVAEILSSIADFVGGTVDVVTGSSSSNEGPLDEDSIAANAIRSDFLTGVGRSFTPELINPVQPSNVVRNTSNTSTSSSPTNISKVEINVTGGDPNRVKQAVLDVLNGQIQQASSNAQTVVAN